MLQLFFISFITINLLINLLIKPIYINSYTNLLIELTNNF
jgi:hypothetical protein